MSKESVFEKMGTGFSTLKIFSGDTIPSRPAKIVRFENGNWFFHFKDFFRRHDPFKTS